MSSAFVWLDFSERERRDALNFIDLFRDKNTRDELGLGTIRDALADRLFPGTSTIQTRARYFLFIPWIYRDLERRQVTVGAVTKTARDREVLLIEALAASEDTQGLIGQQAKAKLKRLPSSVYWQGLGVWGVRKVSASIADYHRYFGEFSSASLRQGEDDADGPRAQAVRPLWDDGIPSPPERFPKEASFALRRVEARYLEERILSNAPGTMLAAVLRLGVESEPTEYPWQYDQKRHLPDKNQAELEHARRFAMISHGAALLYNLLLAELCRNDEKQADFRQRLRKWASADVTPELDQFRTWDRAQFWRWVRESNPRLGPITRRFTDQWIDTVLITLPAREIADDPTARQLVTLREKSIKGALSRFTHPKSLELWNGDSGTGVANYRWNRVQTILSDIMAGGGNA